MGGSGLTPGTLWQQCLLPRSQSAYRRFHSTKTALTKVCNDLLAAADCEQMPALCLLDLSAALDTVDHDLLLFRLERQFGLRGIVLQWPTGTCLAEHSVLCTAGHVVRRFTLRAYAVPQAQSLIRFLYCARRILRTWSLSMVWMYMVAHKKSKPHFFALTLLITPY